MLLAARCSPSPCLHRCGMWSIALGLGSICGSGGMCSGSISDYSVVRRSWAFVARLQIALEERACSPNTKRWSI